MNLDSETYSHLKFVNHGDRLEAIKRGDRAYPVSIRLVLSDLCNHNCNFCIFRMDGDPSNELFGQTDPETGKRNNNPNRMLSREKVFEIIDDCREMGVKSIEFTGGGEPTVFPDHVDVFNKVLDSGIDMALISNGATFRKGLIESLLRSTWCRFSLDAGSNDNYSKIREVHPKTFDKVQNNIKSLTDAKKKFGSDVSIGTGFVVTPSNFHEIYKAIEISSNLGVDNIRVGYFREAGLYVTPSFDQEAKSQLEQAKKDFGSKNFKIIDRYSTTSENISTGSPDYDFCGYQHFSTWIAGDFNVYRCCVTAYNPHGFLGSLKHKGFKDLWDSSSLQEKLKDFKASSCSHCIYNDKNKAINYLLKQDKKHINFL